MRQTGRAEVDVQIRDDADHDDYHAAERQYPSEHRTPVEKQQADAYQQWYQRHSEGIVPPQRPIPAHHRHAAQKQVASGDHHTEAENELADSPGRAASPTDFIFLVHLLLLLGAQASPPAWLHKMSVFQ